ncbi:MAG TPA: hypothetical protein VHC22_21835 [Pirellulales bacterium]|nr:hypothetical protein [Pirellulales bacterium]
MSFNLPPNRLLKLTKGNWSDVHYPTTATVQVQLLPRDYFEPVELNDARSCVPVDGKNFSSLFNANTGRMTLRGETMFPPLSVTFQINNDAWNVIFVGRCMQVTQTIESDNDIDPLLTNCEHTLPALLSVATGLAIFCEALEMGLGDEVEARSETLIPPYAVRVIDPDARIDELKKGIALVGMACGSARFTLAATYFREALYFDSAYYEHNPYTHALVSILKCAQAIEVLFGSRYDAIRDKCRELHIADDIIEADIVRINVTRNMLGSGHASSFVPTPIESEIIRHFAHRAVHTVQQLLLRVSGTTIREHPYLFEKFERDKDKETLLLQLKDTLQRPLWCIDGEIEQRHVVINDPRVGGTS